ncbi:hypothetical protein ABIA22_005348 [Sinorhizobium fredii]
MPASRPSSRVMKFIGLTQQRSKNAYVVLLGIFTSSVLARLDSMRTKRKSPLDVLRVNDGLPPMRPNLRPRNRSWRSRCPSRPHPKPLLLALDQLARANRIRQWWGRSRGSATFGKLRSSDFWVHAPPRSARWFHRLGGHRDHLYASCPRDLDRGHHAASEARTTFVPAFRNQPLASRGRYAPFEFNPFATRIGYGQRGFRNRERAVPGTYGSSSGQPRADTLRAGQPTGSSASVVRATRAGGQASHDKAPGSGCRWSLSSSARHEREFLGFPVGARENIREWRERYRQLALQLVSF